jgi:hypothetical protein
MSKLARDTKATADMAEGMANGRGGSFMERRTRKEWKFDEVESRLPNIKMTPAFERRLSIATRLLSYLGPHNPAPHPITANDEVWLFDNTAYRSADNQWRAEFVTAEFDQRTGQEVSSAVADVAENIGLAKDDAAEATIQERLMPFVQAVLPGRVVRTDFGGMKELKLGPSGRNGVSSDIRGLPEFRNGEIVSSVAKVPTGTTGILKMNTVFAEPEGWGLISGNNIPLRTL